ncbi:DNA-directed RNA polymerases II 24 kDa polypeptide (RNA polymerase II subunit 5) [Extremus antarcticus]|uniref:DNA-directed RNA polymerases I, II, and III subunit RPABC1 n=1 Tax=Extremus antarcticus TaxID=702011 RepID=A0AAJ0GIK5_9PEZI|nr:DNA-directed RNA polymerases II 24 kDa polypeptide (RNA polymerase II subunit 5) [Extremus antarcticus]
MSGNDETSQELTRLWRITRTVKTMCLDRGYELTEDECAIPLSEFRDQVCDSEGAPQRTKMVFTARPSAGMLKRYTPLPTTRRGTEGPVQTTGEPTIGTIHVEFNPSTSVGIKDLKVFAQLLQEKNYYTGIFITQASPTSSALKIIPSLLPIQMEIFKEEDLLVNISRHELVPKHLLLSPEEKRGLLERYRLKETQLPRIRVDDPMARYLGLRRGQVVKIIRKSETAGRYASYRWVI